MRQPRSARPAHRDRRVAAAVLAVLTLAAAALAGCAGSATSGRPSAAPAGWMVYVSSILALQKSGTPSSVLETAFNIPSAYIILNSATTKNPYPDSTTTISFPSYAEMQDAFTHGGIPKGVKAVGFDDEGWDKTPANEKADPLHYVKLCEQLVHAHHLIFINTPSPDIVPKQNKLTRFQSFVAAGGLQAARYADVFALQIEQWESSPATFQQYATLATQEIARINPKAKVLLTLSTFPTGKQVASSLLAQSLSKTRSNVAGYWLNVPFWNKTGCAGCGTRHAEVGRDLLEQLYS